MLSSSSGVGQGSPIIAEISNERCKILLIVARLNPLGEAARGHGKSTTKAVLFEKLVDENEDLKKPGMPEVHVRHLPVLELSADQSHLAWIAIADIIETEYDNYAGFVVQYGTDTMVYAASALSFMLENLGKPVMFTGSLIPMDQVHSDIKRNLILALLFAQNKDICEVCIAFAETLFRANRTFKMSRRDLQPFESPNMPPLAQLRAGRVMLESRLLHRAPRGRLRVHRDLSATILTFKLLPGMKKELAVQMAQTTNAKAIIICAFGTGNVPAAHGDAILQMSKIAAEHDIVVVICTQNRYGTIEPNMYESGMRLVTAGVVGAGDMTIEATIAKLKFLFGLGHSPSEVRSLLLTTLRGELSEEQTIRMAHI